MTLPVRYVGPDDGTHGTPTSFFGIVVRTISFDESHFGSSSKEQTVRAMESRLSYQGYKGRLCSPRAFLPAKGHLEGLGVDHQMASEEILRPARRYLYVLNSSRELRPAEVSGLLSAQVICQEPFTFLNGLQMLSKSRLHLSGSTALIVFILQHFTGLWHLENHLFYLSPFPRFPLLQFSTYFWAVSHGRDVASPSQRN